MTLVQIRKFYFMHGKMVSYDFNQNENVQDEHQIQWKIRFFAFFAIIETFLFAGIPYGWSTLLYVLKDEGIYADLCTHTFKNVSFHNFTEHSSLNLDVENGNGMLQSCPEQDRRFNLWFSITNGIGSTLTILIGYISDHHGVKKTRIIFMLVFVAGSLCMAFVSKGTPWLILPGLLLIYVGGFSVLITNIKIAHFFKPGGQMFLGLLNGSLDSSAIMTRIIKALNEIGINRKYAFIGLSILHVVICSISTIIHIKIVNFTPRQELKIDVPTNFVTQDISTKEYTKKINNPEFKTIEQSQIDKQKQEEKSIHIKVSLMRSIASSLFIVHVIYVTIQVLHYVFFLGFINRKLEIVFKDKHSVEYYTDVMAYTLLGGLFGSFICGSLLECQRRCFSDLEPEKCRNLMTQVLPLTVCSILGILLSSIGRIQSPDVFYAIFVNFVVFRAFIFAVNMAYIASVFPAKFTSVIFGVVIGTSGILSFLQYALFVWAEAYYNALNDVEWFLFVMGVITLVHPLHVFVKARRN